MTFWEFLREKYRVRNESRWKGQGLKGRLIFQRCACSKIISEDQHGAGCACHNVLHGI